MTPPTTAPVRTLLTAAHAIDADQSTDDAWLLFEGDTINDVGAGPRTPPADHIIDLGTCTLVPGFIDLHSHGGGGSAYDDDVNAIRTGLRLHRQHGTTRSIVSLVSNPIGSLRSSLARIRAVMQDDPSVLGAHLEGPFLSPRNYGAHAYEHLQNPARSTVQDLLEAGHGVLRQITIAPELDGAIDAIHHLTTNGIAVAVGHTLADYDLTRDAFDAGATLLTHTFNAMPSIHHRAPGPIIAAIADDRVTMELILDGVHVAPVVAANLFRQAPDRVALITDAMAAAGHGDGRQRLGSLNVDVTNGVAHIAGTTTIAGSTLTQDRALRLAVGEAGLSLQQATTALTRTPARALGIDTRHGCLRPGYVADVVALSPDLDVRSVWVGGECVASCRT